MIKNGTTILSKLKIYKLDDHLRTDKRVQAILEMEIWANSL